MSNSYQNEIPKARINLKLDLHTGGAAKKTELPLKLLVTGDFSNGAEDRPLSEREKINVNKNNFNSVLADIAPTVSFAVPNTLAGDGSEENVQLNFRDMKDFEPEQVARQIPQLRAMLAMRNLLRDLKSNLLDNVAGREEGVIMTPSLYDILYGNFEGDLELERVGEENQVILSVLDNMQRILNSRAGSLAHLPDYGLPDMTRILQGMPGTAHQLMHTLSGVLLKYEPRLKRVDIVMLEQTQPGELRYAIDAELKEVGLVRFGTEFMPEGRVMIRHMKQQQYLDARASV